MKKCNKCSATKPLSDFNKRASSPDGYGTICRKCKSKYHLDYKENGPTAIRHRLSNLNPETRDVICSICGPVKAIRKGVVGGKQKWSCEIQRAKQIRSGHHGLRTSDARRVKDGASCAICGGGESLVIDHCHDTMALRGVLCAPCNSAIGLMKNDPARFANAITYLANPPGIDIEDAS